MLYSTRTVLDKYFKTDLINQQEFEEYSKYIFEKMYAEIGQAVYKDHFKSYYPLHPIKAYNDEAHNTVYELKLDVITYDNMVQILSRQRKILDDIRIIELMLSRMKETSDSPNARNALSRIQQNLNETIKTLQA